MKNLLNRFVTLIVFTENFHQLEQEISDALSTTYGNAKVETNKDSTLMELKRVILNDWSSEKMKYYP